MTVVLFLAAFLAACGSKQESKTHETTASAIQPVAAAPDISIQIIPTEGESAGDLYSLETKTFEVRTSRPLKGDEYFWLGTSHPFVAYVKSYPEHEPKNFFTRKLEKVEVTGGQTGTASFSVMVMESTRTSKSIASANMGVRVLPVPEEDSVTVQRGDTLYELSNVYLNDPEKWHAVVRKNSFLGEHGRVFKRSGKTIVIIRPGEKLNGLARLGIKVRH